MTLHLKIAELSKRAESQKQHLHTEAATSTSLVLPFLAALGYDVFNPLEVVPEFTADVGTKKGEKVDYALVRDGKPQVLIEVKCWNVDLREVQASQLFRYYATTPARIGVLTNGIHYRFYADLVEANKMDEQPFFVFDIRDMRPHVIAELERFSKANFCVDDVLDAASDLRFLSGIKRVFEEEMASPSEGFTRHFASQVYTGRMSAKVMTQFNALVKTAISQLINEKIQSRLSSALDTETQRIQQETKASTALAPGIVAVDGDIITTEEEVQAFHIIRTLVGEVIAPERVFMRDFKTYCSVIIDDNNRRTIARMFFDRAQKHVIIFDEAKVETKYVIDDIQGLYKLGAELRAAAQRFAA